MSDGKPNWALIEPQEVREVADQAARRVHARYGEAIEMDDLRQEALIALVTNPSLIEVLEQDEVEYGLLQYRLEYVLRDQARIRRAARQQQQQTSFDRIEGGTDDELAFAGSYVPAPALAEDYTREAVEMLLPAVWDESYTYGLPAKETAPDPDMPRSASNPKTGNNLPAYIADIKTGWERTPLTHKERRALLMTYGLFWTQKMVAEHEGISQQAISARLYTAVGKIVARLNGGIWYELGLVEA